MSKSITLGKMRFKVALFSIVFTAAAFIAYSSPVPVHAGTNAGQVNSGNDSYLNAGLRNLPGLTLGANENAAGIGAIDSNNNVGYFSAVNWDLGPEAYIIKVDLNTFTEIDRITLDAADWVAQRLIIDSTSTYLYALTNQWPGRIIRIDLATFTRAGHIDDTDLAAQGFYSGVIDDNDEYGYFVTYADPTRIVKVDLSTFAVVGTPLSVTGFKWDESFAMHDGYLYLGNYYNGNIAKINISSLTLEGVLTLDPSENSILPDMIVDADTNMLYAGTYTTPGKIVKVDLSNFSRVSAISLETGENYLARSVYDPINNKAYFTSYNTGILVSIDLNTFSRDGALTGLTGLYGTAIDAEKGHIYGSSGSIFKIAYSQASFINGTKITLSEEATPINSVSFYSHQASGNLRLAIYNSSKELVWQSGVIANSAANNWITVNISQGTPTTLSSLPAGDYYLAYQTDSPASTASYAQGSAGDGFYSVQSFGTFDAAVTGETSTDETWSMYLTYGDPIVSSGSGGSSSGRSSVVMPRAPAGGYQVIQNSTAQTDINTPLQSTNGIVRFQSNAGPDIKYVTISREEHFDSYITLLYSDNIEFDLCLPVFGELSSCISGTHVFYIRFHDQYMRSWQPIPFSVAHIAR